MIIGNEIWRGKWRGIAGILWAREGDRQNDKRHRAFRFVEHLSRIAFHRLRLFTAELTPSTDFDLLRIKIWDKDDGDTVIYDTQMAAEEDAEPTTAIGGGSIVIHEP